MHAKLISRTMSCAGVVYNPIPREYKKTGKQNTAKSGVEYVMSRLTIEALILIYSCLSTVTENAHSFKVVQIQHDYFKND